MDDFAKGIEDAGCHLNNLFQMPDGTWRCNLRKRGAPRTAGTLGDWCYEYADAPTWRQAIDRALAGIGAAQQISRAKTEKWEGAYNRLSNALDRFLIGVAP